MKVFVLLCLLLGSGTLYSQEVERPYFLNPIEVDEAEQKRLREKHNIPDGRKWISQGENKKYTRDQWSRYTESLTLTAPADVEVLKDNPDDPYAQKIAEEMETMGASMIQNDPQMIDYTSPSTRFEALLKVIRKHYTGALREDQIAERDCLLVQAGNAVALDRSSSAFNTQYQVLNSMFDQNIRLDESGDLPVIESGCREYNIRRARFQGPEGPPLQAVPLDYKVYSRE